MSNPHSSDQFEASLRENEPPGEWSLPLQALWWEVRGDWERAHELCQDAESREGDRVHALLHRIEGDESNARYWYSRAGTNFPTQSIDEERKMLVAEWLRD